MSTNQAVHGVQLPQPPNDGITALRFASHSALLLLSSWDGVRGDCAWLIAVYPRADVFLLLNASRYTSSTCFLPIVRDIDLRCAAPAGLQTVRLYDADRQQLRATHTQAQAVLDTTFEDDTAAFAAGLEGSVQRCKCTCNGCGRRLGRCAHESSIKLSR
jgi:hypothetical protein